MKTVSNTSTTSSSSQPTDSRLRESLSAAVRLFTPSKGSEVRTGVPKQVKNRQYRLAQTPTGCTIWCISILTGKGDGMQRVDGDGSPQAGRPERRSTSGDGRVLRRGGSEVSSSPHAVPRTERPRSGGSRGDLAEWRAWLRSSQARVRPARRIRVGRPRIVGGTPSRSDLLGKGCPVERRFITAREPRYASGNLEPRQCLAGRSAT